MDKQIKKLEKEIDDLQKNIQIEKDSLFLPKNYSDKSVYDSIVESIHLSEEKANRLFEELISLTQANEF